MFQWGTVNLRNDRRQREATMSAFARRRETTLPRASGPRRLDCPIWGADSGLAVTGGMGGGVFSEGSPVGNGPAIL